MAEKVNYKRMVKITYPERGISYAAQSVAKCARFERESSGALHQLLAGVQRQREEDPSGGFERGGWAAPYNVMQSREAGEGLSSFGSLLMWRRTYEIFANYFPKHPDNPFTDRLTNMQKYVASTTLREPLLWKNPTLLYDVPEAVTALKAQPGDDLIVWGSGELIQTLIKHNLIDRYILLVRPFVLGSERRLFPDGGELTRLQLVSAKATDNGVAVLTYEASTVG